MEINKISDTQIEVTDIVKSYYNKKELEREKAGLESRLNEVNNLLKEFDK